MYDPHQSQSLVMHIDKGIDRPQGAHHLEVEESPPLSPMMVDVISQPSSEMPCPPLMHSGKDVEVDNLSLPLEKG